MCWGQWRQAEADLSPNRTLQRLRDNAHFPEVKLVVGRVHLSGGARQSVAGAVAGAGRRVARVALPTLSATSGCF